MKRFLSWLFFGILPPEFREHTVIDLPEEWGPRMRLQEVHGLFLDPGNREMICAFVQVLWMNRTRAQDQALNCAATKTGNPDLHLGEIECVNNALAAVQVLMAESLRDDRGERMDWAATDRMREWFRGEELGQG